MIISFDSPFVESIFLVVGLLEISIIVTTIFPIILLGQFIKHLRKFK